MKHPASYDTTPEISARMAKVKLKRGDAETLLAKALWHKGIRYRLNDKRLPGSPDIAITKERIAVFVDGEFWHGYDWMNKKAKLKKNREYWIEKIEENMKRDVLVDQKLMADDWIPIRFWSKEVVRDTDSCVQIIEELILEKKLLSLERETPR